MGIKKINDIIKNNAPKALGETPLTNFKRIAIDGTNWIHKTWAIAWKGTVNKTNIGNEEPDREEARKIWIRNSQRFINKLLASGVTPIFVVDGRHPEEKAETKEKRNTVREKSKERLEAMKERLGKEEVDIDDVRKSYANNMNLTYDETELLIVMLKAVGIPILQAKGEAEQLCSMMCKEGLVEGVYSTDTDTLAYGCPLLLTGMNKRGDGFTSVDLNVILSSLQISFETFVDLCIMCGCDYNKNIPKIGPVRVLELIKQYGQIEKLPKTYRNIPLDLTVLKYETCRELFGSQLSVEICEDELQIDIKKENLLTARDILETMGAELWIEELNRYYKNFA